MSVCHTPIFNDEVVRGLYDFADFLQYIVSIYGKEIYKDKYKLANLIADLYVGEEKIKTCLSASCVGRCGFFTNL